MSVRFRYVPLDRMKIAAWLRFNPDLLANPNQFIIDRNLPIRSSKPSRGRRNNRPTRELALDVLTYKGIKITISVMAGESLAFVTIHFNPGVVLYGVNGHVITVDEFIDALAILVAQLKPLLADPNDWPCLVPGLRRGGSTYWSYLEVMFQCADPDGSLLAGFRNLRHELIKTATRHWPESIRAGGKRSKLVLSIYRKAMEMHTAGKLTADGLDTYGSVLRFEARMKEDKLVHYFGNGSNVELIDGIERLVWFHPADLIRGHRKAFVELHGIYALDGIVESTAKPTPLEARGRLLVDLASDPRVPFTLYELLQFVIDYTGADRSGTTITAMRKAGELELSRRSTISRDLFSDAAYQAQHSVRNRELEALVRHDIRTLIPHRLIVDTYRPADQPPDYISDFPSYIKP